MKMKLFPFLSNSDSKPSSPAPWQWPSCANPKTQSLRPTPGDVVRMANSAFVIDPPDICFTSSSSFAGSSRSLCAMSDQELGDPVEMVIKGLSSERLFYEPGESSSFLATTTTTTTTTTTMADNNNNNNEDTIVCDAVPYKESVAMSMDSEDPYSDFRRSMEEMVKALGLKDWEGLEELLCWYLKVNGKSNHGYIVGAFIDLLASLTFASDSGEGESSSFSASSSFTISHSSLPSSPLSLPSSSSQVLDPTVQDSNAHLP